MKVPADYKRQQKCFYLKIRINTFKKVNTIRKKKNINVCISGNSLSMEFKSPLFPRETSTKAAVINLVEPPWWPLTKGQTALHHNMIPALLFLKLLQYIMPSMPVLIRNEPK